MTKEILPPWFIWRKKRKEKDKRKTNNAGVNRMATCIRALEVESTLLMTTPGTQAIFELDPELPRGIGAATARSRPSHD